MDEAKEQAAIDDGKAAYDFLSSDTGKRMIVSRNEDFFKKWSVAKTAIDREQVFAEFRAFNTMVTDIETLNGAGQTAKAMKADRTKLREREEKMHGSRRNG